MDGWMGGWVDGWMDGWIGGWMDGLDLGPLTIKLCENKSSLIERTIPL